MLTAFFLAAGFFLLTFLAAFLTTFLATFFLATFFLLAAFLAVFLATFFLATFLLAGSLLDGLLFRDFFLGYLLLGRFLSRDAFFLLTAFFFTTFFFVVVFLAATFLREAGVFFRFLLAAFFAGILGSCRGKKRPGLYIACGGMEVLFSGEIGPQFHYTSGLYRRDMA